MKGHPVNASKRPYGENPGSYMLNESIDLQLYLHNGEWDLMSTPGTRVVTPFGVSSYHELYYYIRIRRRTLAYGINLIIPSLVISMMTVLGFTLPPDACEKITLETTVLVSVIFFLQMVSNMSPPQSKSVPILAAFFSCCLMVLSQKTSPLLSTFFSLQCSYSSANEVLQPNGFRGLKSLRRTNILRCFALLAQVRVTQMENLDGININLTLRLRGGHASQIQLEDLRIECPDFNPKRMD